jgi:hypothetical protein
MAFQRRRIGEFLELFFRFWAVVSNRCRLFSLLAGFYERTRALLTRSTVNLYALGEVEGFADGKNTCCPEKAASGCVAIVGGSRSLAGRRTV